jgi:hypothetical protein
MLTLNWAGANGGISIVSRSGVWPMRCEDRRGFILRHKAKAYFGVKARWPQSVGTNRLGEDETTHVTLTYETLAKRADAEAHLGPTPRRFP